MKDKEVIKPDNEKVVNFASHLKLVADNKRKRQERKLSKGEVAIDLLKEYKETARRLRTISFELEKSHSSLQTLEMMQWYLESLFQQNTSNPLQGLFLDYGGLLLGICLDKQEYEIAFHEAKESKPKPTKPKGD